VAEGMETAVEFDLLRSLGCDYGQGSLISPPVPANAVQAWIRDEQERLYAICGQQPLCWRATNGKGES
jgi:sensor c-di-GMP phosphodiesterase-like protein